MDGELDTRPKDEFRSLVLELVSENNRILDGNYGSLRDVIWPRATAVVWLNYSFVRTGWRGICRTIPRSFTGEELWAGNRESMSRSFFSKDSILWWLATSYGRRKSQHRDIFDNGKYAGAAKIEIRRPRDAEHALRSL